MNATEMQDVQHLAQQNQQALAALLQTLNLHTAQIARLSRQVARQTHRIATLEELYVIHGLPLPEAAAAAAPPVADPAAGITLPGPWEATYTYTPGYPTTLEAPDADPKN